MTEAERLQKIVQAQEVELRRIRRLLSVARVAHAEFQVVEGVLSVTVSCIGVDEYHFTQQALPELKAIAEAIVREKATVEFTGEIKDAITGEPMEGGVAPL